MAKKKTETQKYIGQMGRQAIKEVRAEGAARKTADEAQIAKDRAERNAPPKRLSAAQKRVAAQQSGMARSQPTVFSSPAAASEAAQIRATQSGVMSPTDYSVGVSPINVPTGVRTKKGQGPDIMPVTPRVSMLPTQLAMHDARVAAGDPGQQAAISNIMSSSSSADQLKFKQSLDAVNRREIISKHLDPVETSPGSWMTRADYLQTTLGRGSAPVSLSARPTTHNSLPSLPSSPYTSGGQVIRDATGRPVMSGGAAGFGAAHRSLLEATLPGGPAGRVNRIAGLEHEHRAMFGHLAFPKAPSDSELHVIKSEPSLTYVHRTLTSPSGQTSDVGGQSSGVEDIPGTAKEMDLIEGYRTQMGGMIRSGNVPSGPHPQVNESNAEQIRRYYANRQATADAQRAAQPPRGVARVEAGTSDEPHYVVDPANMPLNFGERMSDLGTTATTGVMTTRIDEGLKAATAAREAERRKGAIKRVNESQSTSKGTGALRRTSEAAERIQRAKAQAIKTKKKGK